MDNFFESLQTVVKWTITIIVLILVDCPLKVISLVMVFIILLLAFIFYPITKHMDMSWIETPYKYATSFKDILISRYIYKLYN